MEDYDKQLEAALSASTHEYVVWYTGSRDQALFVASYSKVLNGNSLCLPLPDNAVKGHSKFLSDKFINYFFLDFPDVIISKRDRIDDLPVLGIEILEQKPVGWNHTQRFARAAASAIKNVSFAYVLPQRRYLFDKEQGKAEEKEVYIIGGERYKLNLRREYQLLFALYKLSEIHQIPCLPFFWPIDDENVFLSEGLVYNNDQHLKWRQLPPPPIDKINRKCYPEMVTFFDFIDLALAYDEQGGTPTDLMNEHTVQRALKRIKPGVSTLYDKKNVTLKDPDGGNVKIAKRVSTNKFIEELKEERLPLHKTYLEKLLGTEELSKILSRSSSILIQVDSDPKKGGRGFADPYSGVVASFDYRYCRDQTKSKKTSGRDLNLIFVANHKNSTKFFNDSIKHFVNPSQKIKLSAREDADDTFSITRELFAQGPFRLNKNLKNLFYFCDLIITPENIFAGLPCLQK